MYMQYGTYIIVLTLMAIRICSAMDCGLSDPHQSLLEFALTNAPDSLKKFESQIEQSNIAPRNLGHRTFLLGTHGIGKTTLAKAVAHAVQKKCTTHFVSCMNKSEKIVVPDLDPASITLVIFDDVDTLFEKQGSTCLQSILHLFDPQEEHPHLHILSTLHSLYNAPDSVKSRALGHLIALPDLTQAKKLVL